MDFKFYYNNVPGKGLCRNNLIYTSLVNSSLTVFRQWYYNDTTYHRDQNQVVDSTLMSEKWASELCWLHTMSVHYPELVPRILSIDLVNKTIDLEIQGVDFWQQTLDNNCSYEDILPDWQEQMLAIFRAHKDLGIYKYSLHPSSYFIVNGQLKSINYFFCYNENDPPISLRSVMSHISKDRQEDLLPKMADMGIDIDTPTAHKQIQQLAFESFRTNYPADFIEKAKCIYD